MAEELELSDYMNAQELKGSKVTNAPAAAAEKSDRRLLRLGLLTLALLCIAQAALNLSLRIAFHSKANVDPLPVNGSLVLGLCQKERQQQNSTHLSQCCTILLMRLLRENEVLEKERDVLREKIRNAYRDGTINENFESLWIRGHIPD